MKKSRINWVHLNDCYKTLKEMAGSGWKGVETKSLFPSVSCPWDVWYSDNKDSWKLYFPFFNEALHT